MGGWVEGWLRFCDRAHSHAGYGIDDPLNRSLSAGRRLRNEFWFANVFWDVTPLFTIGAEVSYWRTTYAGLSDAESVRIETSMQYRF